jgi:hypothetical protein
MRIWKKAMDVGYEALRNNKTKDLYRPHSTTPCLHPHENLKHLVRHSAMRIWKKAMDVGYEVLRNNKTWHLVAPTEWNVLI